MEEKYFGSIKFFKNLILLVVIVAILVPTVIAVRNAGAKKEAEALESRVAVLENDLNSFRLLEADGASYQELYPDFYAETPLTMHFEAPEKTVYLTFDGGPSSVTEEILDVLETNKIKATFFVSLRESESAGKRLEAIAEGGHAIGFYTAESDLNTVYISVEEFLKDMYICYSWIKETTGVAPTVFRMPGGSVNSYNLTLYREMIAEMLRRGFVPFDWNVSGKDAGGIGIDTKSVSDTVIEGVRAESRAVVSLHDAVENETTAAAVQTVIDVLEQSGYSFQPLTDTVKPVLFTYR